MDCEMCGREEAAVRATVEGTTLSLCNGCSRYGKVVGRVQAPAAAGKKKEGKTPAAAEENTEAVIANLGQLLKQKREQLGLRQDEFARKIAVKESILHKMETGQFLPGIDEARRIGKLLGMKLMEKAEIAESIVPLPKSGQLTLGDMIKIKKK